MATFPLAWAFYQRGRSTSVLRDDESEKDEAGTGFFRVALIGDIPFFVGWCLMRFNEYNNKKALFFDGVFEVLRIVSFSWPLFLGVVDTTKVFLGLFVDEIFSILITSPGHSQQFYWIVSKWVSPQLWWSIIMFIKIWPHILWVNPVFTPSRDQPIHPWLVKDPQFLDAPIAIRMAPQQLPMLSERISPRQMAGIFKRPQQRQLPRQPPRQPRKQRRRLRRQSLRQRLRSPWRPCRWGETASRMENPAEWYHGDMSYITNMN